MENSEIIEILGGTSKVSRLCGVSPAAVCQWRKNGIPEDRLILLATQLEMLTGGKFNRKERFPSKWQMIWGNL
jgi:DNA-binding transcriptional regulator YdaS (Cro superfamily)